MDRLNRVTRNRGARSSRSYVLGDVVTRVRVGRPRPSTPTPTGDQGFLGQRYRLDLAAALSGARVAIAGNVFWITSASDSAAVAQVQFVKDGRIGELIDVAQGFRLFGVDYDYVLVTATAQAAKYLIVTYGTDPRSRNVEGDTV